MNDVFDAIIFYEDLSSDQKVVLWEALNADPELAKSFKKWQALQNQVRSSLDAHLPNRELLVLYALSQDSSHLLTEAENRALTAARTDLDEAFRRHPALQDVIKDLQSAQADFEALWEDYTEAVESETEINQRLAPGRPPAKPVRKVNKLYRVASLFLLFAFVTTAGIFIWRSQNLEIVKTSAGEFRVVELMDGSTVRLFGKSKIKYTKHTDRFAANRSIELIKGQAFFDIAPDENPFIVETATALTQATGTKFSIEADRSLTKVILTAGQVAVSSKQRDGDDVLLAPGQMSQIPRRKLPSAPETIGDLTNMLSWTGLLVFHDTPLVEVATHLSEYYNVSVQIAPPLREEQWVATYDPDTLSVNQILDNLAATLGANVQTTGEDSFLLSR